MIGIYKITNPNGRIYIGQSTNIESRWVKYKKMYCKDQPSIYNSLKKYGPENHKFEVVEECLVEHLDEKEIYWGQYFNVLSNKHLNNRLGRGFGSFDSDITRKKKSESNKGISRNKGKILTQEHKDKISLSKTGFKYHKEFGEKLSNILKNKPKPKGFMGGKNKSKPIIQYDLEGNFIKEWNSGKEAATFLNVKQSNINACCNNKIKHYKGYIWEFKIS